METAPHSTPAIRVSTAASGARARRFPSWTAALRYAEAQAARGRIARLWIDDGCSSFMTVDDSAADHDFTRRRRGLGIGSGGAAPA